MADPQASVEEVEMETIGSSGDDDDDDDDDEVATALRESSLSELPPPITELDPVPGYETIDFSETFAPPPPPSYAETMGLAIQNEGERQVLPADFLLNADDMREALLSHVDATFCWGSRAARNMQLTDVDMQAATHYVLETFTETRAISQGYQPYRGDSIDGPSNGPAPAPWDISISRPSSFNDSTMWMPIPHTESVRDCYSCSGSGHTRCRHCNGRGRIRCPLCHGKGTRRVYRVRQMVKQRCTSCRGTGRRQCMRCRGLRWIDCPICRTHCQLKHFIKLSVTWKTHKIDFISERTNLPEDFLKTVSGQEVFREEETRLIPISRFPNSELVEASRRLIEEHSHFLGNSVILAQRHYIRLLPVYEVSFQWDGKSRRFIVYGFERKVYAPDYPHQCCWGCNIL